MPYAFISPVQAATHGRSGEFYFVFPDHHYDHHPAPRPRARTTIVIPIASEPKAPSSLSANAKESGIELNWVKSSDNNYGYYVMRSENFGNTFGMVEFVGAGVSSYFDSSVNVGTTYYYFIQNVRGDGSLGKRSNEAVVKALGHVIPKVVMVPRIINESDDTAPAEMNAGPEAPDAISAKYSNKAVKITWNESENAVGYEIYKASQKPSAFKLIGEVKGATSFEDKKIEKSSRYYYYVISFNDAGRSGSSNIAAIGGKNK